MHGLRSSKPGSYGQARRPPSLPNPPVIFYGGKGGVGKTTCAAAHAVTAGAAGARVLIVSTDPAHSLGDALGCRLSSHVTAVKGSRVHAVELDAPRAFARWLNAHRRALADIIEHGTWLDRDDVEALLGLSIPGVDELVGMLEIMRLARDVTPERESLRSSAAPAALAGVGSPRELKKSSARGGPSAAAAPGAPGGAPHASQYDLIVVDTAPTGHTLRLLNAPATVATVADALDALQEGHRLIRAQFARVTRPEVADRLIDLLSNQAAETGRLLRDGRRVGFQWVTLPEELSLAESLDALTELTRAGIAVTDIIINRAIPAGPPCPLCDRRRSDQRQTILQIRRQLNGRRNVRIVSAEITEPRGVRALTKVGKQLIDHSRKFEVSSLTSEKLQISDFKLTPRPPSSPASAVPERLVAFRGAKLLLFGGKGGVGKTTVAAAAALRLARATRKRRVLLLSTDPAHSLSDVFKTPIGNRTRRVAKAPGNLDVRELDAPSVFRVRRAAFQTAFDEIASAFGAGHIGLSTGGPGVERLMDLAPPGIDELFGMLSVIEARDRYDLIVVDTAPTGHALRLLETPDAAREWVQVLMRVLLKYKSLVRPGQLAAELVDVSKSIRELQALLRDPRQARFIVVTRAASVPRAETERLLERLHRLRISTPAVVVNAMTLTSWRCPRCRATAAAERRELAVLRASMGGRSRECAIIQTPLTAPPPRGAVTLDRWAGSWREDKVKSRKSKVKSERQNAKAQSPKPKAQSPKPVKHTQIGTYVYCVVRAGRRPMPRRLPAALPGMGPVRLLDLEGGVWLVAADIPLDRYSEEAINRKLSDLDWVSRAAVAHEAVIESFVHTTAVLPTKLFTIFSSDERALEDMRRDRSRIAALVKRVANHDEWGVRVVRHGARQADAPRAAAKKTRGNGGVGYLSRKKAQRDEVAELAAHARETVASLYDRLAAKSRLAKRRTASELPIQGGPLLLDAAFLVPRARAKAFRALVARQARSLHRHGYGLALTGPWPPYSFVQG